MRLTSFSVEAVFPLPLCAGSLILLPQPPVAETGLSYRRVHKMFTDLECRLPYPYTTTSQRSKATFYFLFSEKVFTVEKSHPPELSLAGDCIVRFKVVRLWVVSLCLGVVKFEYVREEQNTKNHSS